MSLTYELQIKPKLCTIFLMHLDTSCFKKKKRIISIFSVTFYFSKFVSKQNIVSHVYLDFVLGIIHIIFLSCQMACDFIKKSTKNDVQNKYDIE